MKTFYLSRYDTAPLKMTSQELKNYLVKTHSWLYCANTTKGMRAWFVTNRSSFDILATLSE
jgi:hypothetical protein